MASYLVVKNGTESKKYECKTTNTGSPFLKVDSGYLDLTTNTTTGLHPVIRMGSGTATTTSSRSSEYAETTGYSGVGAVSTVSDITATRIFSAYYAGTFYSTGSSTSTSGISLSSSVYIIDTSTFSAMTQTTAKSMHSYLTTISHNSDNYNNYTYGVSSSSSSSGSGYIGSPAVTTASLFVQLGNTWATGTNTTSASVTGVMTDVGANYSFSGNTLGRVSAKYNTNRYYVGAHINYDTTKIMNATAPRYRGTKFFIMDSEWKYDERQSFYTDSSIKTFIIPQATQGISTVITQRNSTKTIEISSTESTYKAAAMTSNYSYTTEVQSTLNSLTSLTISSSRSSQYDTTILLGSSYYRPTIKATSTTVTGYSGTINGYLLTEKYSTEYNTSYTDYNTNNIETSSTCTYVSNTRTTLAFMELRYGGGYAGSFFTTWTSPGAVAKASLYAANVKISTDKIYNVPYCIANITYDAQTSNLKISYHTEVTTTLPRGDRYLTFSGMLSNNQPTAGRFVYSLIKGGYQNVLQNSFISGFHWRGIKTHSYEMTLYDDIESQWTVCRELHYSNSLVTSNSADYITNETRTQVITDITILSSTINSSNNTYSVPMTTTTITEV